MNFHTFFHNNVSSLVTYLATRLYLEQHCLGGGGVGENSDPISLSRGGSGIFSLHLDIFTDISLRIFFSRLKYIEPES